MCKQLQLLEDFVPISNTGATFLLDHTGGLPIPDPLTALSGNEPCFSLRLCFSNDVCSAPISWRTRNQKLGFMA